MRQTLLLSFFVVAASAFALPPDGVERPLTHYILVPNHALQPDEVADLQAKGVTIGRTLGPNRYMVRVRDVDAVASDLRIRSLEPFDGSRKIAPSAYTQAAASPAFGTFRVVFHDEVSLEDARAAIEEAGGSDPLPFTTSWRLPSTIAARVPVSALQKLASDDRVFGIYGPPLRPRAENAVAAAVSHVTPLFSAPYNLTGDGVSLSLFELAPADGTHIQFQGRYDTSRVSDCSAGSTCSGNKLHATHTAGTLISAGLNDPKDSRGPASKGMAPGAAHLYEFSVVDDFGAIVSHKDTDLKALGVSADNNSWDFVIGWSVESGQNVWNGDFFGAYGDPTYQSPYEAITLQANSPLFVHSAGNDASQGAPALAAPFSPHLHCCDQNGNTIKNETFCYSPNGSGTDCGSPCSPGMSSITGEQHCETTKHPSIGPYTTIGIEASLKNVVTVGAMDQFYQVGSFSSRGPTKDGRVKPELVAKGISQISTAPTAGFPNYTGAQNYTTLQGTSMSSPVVAGISALLVQQWRKTFSGQNPVPAVLKTLLIAGADDQLGPAGTDLPGPDYTYGFGVVDAQKSVDLIIADGGTGSRIKTGTVHNGDTIEFPMAVASPQDLRVVLGWFDPDIVTTSDTPLDVPALLNDLDLKVIDPSGNTVLPYVLDKANPGNAATRGVNTVDTTEEVAIKNAAAGQYRVIVTAKLGDTVKHPTQDFALVANSPLQQAAPACSDNFEPNDTQAQAYKYLASGQAISARTCSAQDLDFYDIDVQKGGAMSITVTATDTPLHVTLTGNGLTATAVDVPAQSTKSINVTASAGIYDVEVQPNGTLGTTSTYTLTAAFPQPSTTPRHRPSRH